MDMDRDREFQEEKEVKEIEVVEGVEGVEVEEIKERDKLYLRLKINLKKKLTLLI